MKLDKLFRNGWGGHDSFESQFETTIDPEIELLLCTDTSEMYEGRVDIIARDVDGRLFEVYSGHCSCYGHEGNWSTDGTVTLESLKLRKDYPGMDEAEWQKFLTHLEAVL